MFRNIFRPIIIISIIFLFLSISGGVFFCWPKFQDFQVLRKDLEGLEKEVVQKEQYFAQISDISDKMSNYSVELAKIDSALAIDPSIPALFDFVRKAALESGLVIENLSLKSIPSFPGQTRVSEINFSPSVSGTYSAFKNFLSALYKSGRIIEVNNISFSSPEDNDLFTFSLDLTTYSYLKEKKESEEKEFKR